MEIHMNKNLEKSGQTALVMDQFINIERLMVEFGKFRRIFTGNTTGNFA
jgi:hypothetical protein